jgi:hypothetical protein
MLSSSKKKKKVKIQRKFSNFFFRIQTILATFGNKNDSKEEETVKSLKEFETLVKKNFNLKKFFIQNFFFLDNNFIEKYKTRKFRYCPDSAFSSLFFRVKKKFSHLLKKFFF